MIINRKLTLLLSVFTAFAGLSSLFTSLTIQAESAAEEIYEIYPTPHKIAYRQNTLNITSKVNFLPGSEIDAPTKRHFYDTLSLIDAIAYEDNVQERTSFYLGVYGSGDPADLYVQNKDLTSFSLFEKTDAYYLGIDDSSVVILGRNSDAAYYGITTLNHIFRQVKNRTVRQLTVEDYADSELRGFIEGYYGIPWTTAERIELMRFGSQFKSNIYIYAPKDDAYHSSNWRGLYSDKDLAELKEQIKAGNETKTRFAWSIHPFLHNPIQSSDYQGGLDIILGKFEQLYEAGVRQFVISADDVEVSSTKIVDPSLHRDLLNDVSAWCKEKGDCYDLIFVPSAYCYRSEELLKIEPISYFEGLTENLDSSVKIMWTGNSICSSVQTGKFDDFTQWTGRKAFMWLNWPVNDYSPSHLLMGKGDVLNYALPEGETPNFLGIVTNPMQQAEPSKLSIFAVSDYCWNMRDFNVEQSYADSFKYIETNAPDELMELCSHLVNATLYEGKYFDESVDFIPLFNRFIGDYYAGEDISESGLALKNQFAFLVQSAENYLKNGSNAALKESIRPWIEALSLLAQAAEKYLGIEINLSSLSPQEQREELEEADSLVEAMSECKAPMLNTATYNHDMRVVSVAPAVLNGYLKTLASIAEDDVKINLGLPTGVRYSGFESIYQGSLSDVTDHDDSTFVWFGSAPSEDAYLRIDLGEEIEIQDVRCLTGNSTGRDTWNAIVEYSVDGKNYIPLGETTGEETIIDLRTSPVTGRFIRLRNNGTTTWVAVKDISVNRLETLTCDIRFGNMEYASGVNTTKYSMIDESIETYTWFNNSNTEGAYIELDLLKATEIFNTQILMCKPTSIDDYFKSSRLSYSLDGTHYTDVKDFSSRNVYHTFSTPITARYLRLTATKTSSNGVVVRDFSVNRDYAVTFGSSFKVYDYVRSGYPISHVDYATDGNDRTFLDLEDIDKTTNSDRTIALNLFEAKEITSLDIVSGGISWGDRITDCTIEYSPDGTNYERLGQYASEDGLYHLSFDPIQAKTVRITVNNSGWITLREISAA